MNQPKIFETNLRYIIDNFWDRAFYLLVINNVIYMLYAALLTADLRFTVEKIEDTPLQWGLFLFACILFSREVVTIFLATEQRVYSDDEENSKYWDHFVDHIKDFRNIFDMFGSACYIIYHLLRAKN